MPSAWRDAAEIIEGFLAERSARTRRAYGTDLEDFGSYLGAESRVEALQELLRSGLGGAFQVVTRYKTHLRERGLSSATVNRRLASLRSLVKFCRAAGLVTWRLEVQDVKSERRRDSAGPSRDVIQAALNSCRQRDDAKGVRDAAIIRLLFDLVLRRGEVANLDVADVSLDAGVVYVVGKGKRERESRTLPEPTAEALRGWLAVRGDSPGPLFTNCDPARKGDGRLTPWAIWHICKRLGFRPHGLRHSGITAALDAGADLRAVQRFSRHADLKTVMVYDDSRADLAGDVARKVAATLV